MKYCNNIYISNEINNAIRNDYDYNKNVPITQWGV